MKFILWFRRRISDRPGSAFVADLSAKTGVTATAPRGHDRHAEDSLTAGCERSSRRMALWLPLSD
jgi:hypothetical protein